ncbi:MAG: hypothetical protein HYV90_05650 [Candidatus Woesebacteria bacterium]|nr:MAG: hypothetical protein HYV90_05650 [Candidatus Woesebacteria bacterium]
MQKFKSKIKSSFNFFNFLIVFFTFYFLLFTFSDKVAAQEVSLSISPPLTEIVIQPGKSLNQTITVRNDGVPVTVVAKIVPFVPLDTNGHVELIEDQNSIDAFSSWFYFDQRPTSLGVNERHDFIIKITPPDSTEQRDYYFTFLVEVQANNNIGVNNSESQARIGANILLTATKDGNPQKNVSIVKFSAPKLVDSFTGFSYQVILGNSGSGFFKPVGKITVDQIFGTTTTLNLAPLNVLVGGEREITCLEGQEIISCALPGKFLIGIYRANLSFTVDGVGESYEKQIYTIAFPFTVLLGLITITITYSIIRRLNAN